jgi:hypothetical protein
MRTVPICLVPFLFAGLASAQQPEPQQQLTSAIWFYPRACKVDAAKLCKDAAEEKVDACLTEHSNELSADCTAARQRAAELSQFKICKGDPQLDAASFVVSFQPDHGGPSLKWTFKFDHCSQMGRSDGPAMQAERVYRSKDGEGLLIRTDLSAAVSRVSLITFSSGGRHWLSDLDLFFNSDLVSGKPLKVPGRLKSDSNGGIPELTGSLTLMRDR